MLVAILVNDPVVGLVRVMVCAALDVPCGWGAKPTTAGVSVGTGYTVPVKVAVWFPSAVFMVTVAV